MAYNDRKIKLDASEKEINKKFKNEIENTEEKIYWYIKFSLPLNRESVSRKTMNVTDTKGYIFKTKIIYNKALELIIIEALEPYEEEEYYILHISKNIQSESLKNLKKDVHILFKIKGGVVVEYKEVGENVTVPKPRKKPKVAKKNVKSKVYSFSKDNIESVSENKLPYVHIKFNPFVAIAGVPLFLIGIFLTNHIIIALGGVVACLGFAHILLQVLKRDFRTKLNYNLGVVNFNKEKYIKANKRFKKALNIDAYNEYAEYALNKVSFFLE